MVCHRIEFDRSRKLTTAQCGLELKQAWLSLMDGVPKPSTIRTFLPDACSPSRRIKMECCGLELKRAPHAGLRMDLKQSRKQLDKPSVQSSLRHPAEFLSALSR